MRQFEFTYKLLGSGSAEAWVFVDGRGVQMIISYISDALRDLARAVTDLFNLPDGGQVRFSWEDESGEYRWIINRHGDAVTVKIVKFERCFSKLDDNRGELLFQVDCSLLRLATQVRGQIKQIFNEHGLDGYCEQWRNFSFPLDELDLLTKLIGENRTAKVEDLT